MPVPKNNNIKTLSFFGGMYFIYRVLGVVLLKIGKTWIIDNILNRSLFLKNHANVAQPGRASDL